MNALTSEEINLIPEENGVYKIFAMDSKGKPVEINRFSAKDKSGLLYIGRTLKQSLKVRLYQFLASSNGIMKMHNHSGGLMYSENEIIRETLGPDHSLFFEYEVTDKPSKYESDLLNKYASIFGEYPPLNK